MARIETALTASDVSGVLLCGATGVGKSRIAREALTAAAARGFHTRWTVGTSSARSIPLGAFTAWAPSGLTDTVALIRGVVDSLTAAPAGEQVLVGIDDVHLLDDLSTFVMHQIVQHGSAKLIVTVRADEPVPSAVQEVWRAGQFERLDVAPLTPDETATLMSSVLDGRVDADATRRLWQLTRGNVLYLRNIVEQAVADGRMAREHGRLCWNGDPIVPPGLTDLIESRIGALPTPVGDVVDVLSVAEPLDLAVLTRITDKGAVEEAEMRGLIAVEPAGSAIEVRTAHPLYGQVRRMRAPRTRLRRLRGLVAAELASTVDCDEVRVVVRRATLVDESDLAPDADLFTRAAHGAVGLGDLLLADRMAQAAVRAGAGGELDLVRAHALSWLGRGQEAEEVLADMRTDQLTERDHGRFAFLRSSNMLWALADPARAKELIDHAQRSASGEARTYIDAFLTVYWFAMDRPSEALRCAANLALADIPVVGAELAWALAQISADAGRTSDSVEVAETGYAAASRSLDAPHMIFNIADAHVSALVLAGLVADAREVADRVRRQAAVLPGTAGLLGAAVAGRAALSAGDLRDACLLLERAVEGLSGPHPVGWGYRYRIPYATALAMRGATHEAASTLAPLDENPRRFRPLDFERGLAEAWISAGQGAASEAIPCLQATAERCRDAGKFAEEVICLQTATQFGDRTTAPRLRELECVTEGPRAGLASRFATALRDDDATELSIVSAEFERMGDLAAAVDSVAHAAIAFRHHGKRGSALGCSTRAAALADKGGGIQTVVLRQASQDVPLTDREAEIVMLIGEGLSNRAIAERLTLSLRTVESHIYRAMSKTGTASRDELATLFPRRR